MVGHPRDVWRFEGLFATGSGARLQNRGVRLAAGVQPVCAGSYTGYRAGHLGLSASRPPTPVDAQWPERDAAIVDAVLERPIDEVVLVVDVVVQVVERFQRLGTLGAVVGHDVGFDSGILLAVHRPGMADDKVSISTYVDAEGGPKTFDADDWEDLLELDELVAEHNGESSSKSKTIRSALTCYLGVLEAFAEHGDLEYVPSDIDLKFWSRQMALQELRRMDDARDG